MGTLGLGDLLGPFRGDDVGGLVHVTIRARAKGNVGVDAAIVELALVLTLGPNCVRGHVASVCA